MFVGATLPDATPVPRPLLAVKCYFLRLESQHIFIMERFWQKNDSWFLSSSSVSAGMFLEADPN